jgi:hypothetical protein
MLTWQDIEKFVTHGNPPANQRVVKTGAQWRSLLTNWIQNAYLARY